MRGVGFAVATMVVAIAGCGLATSGLFDPSSTVPSLDGSSAIVTPTFDANGPPTTNDAGPPQSDSGDDAGSPITPQDAASDGPPSTGSDASCVDTQDAATIATITSWPAPPAPKIDGVLSEWPCDGRIDFSATNAAYTKPSTHSLSATVQARWDKQNVYLAVHVIDSTVGGNDAVDPYNNDSVEVYVSGDSSLNGDYDVTTHQYITDWKGLVVDYGPSHAGDNPDTKPAHFVAASVTVSDGWTFEASIGWQALYGAGGAVFASGTSLALDLEINDGDGTSQIAALVLTLAPAQPTCTCVQNQCCCGATNDLPSCDSARIGRVTLE